MNEIEDVILLLLQNKDNKAKIAIKSVENEDIYTNEYLRFIEIFIKGDYERCKQAISSWGSVSLKDSEMRNHYLCIQQVLKLMTYKALKEIHHINKTIKEITSLQSVNSIYSKKFQSLFESTSETIQKSKINSDELSQISELENFIKLYQEDSDLSLDSKWFIISSTWVKKYFLKLGLTDSSKYPNLPFSNFIDPSSSTDLGKISNETILEEVSKDQLDPHNKFCRALKSGLQENLDYLLIPQKCFKFLSIKYGAKEAVQRNIAINKQGKPFIEIYLKQVSVVYCIKSDIISKSHLVSNFERVSEIVKLALRVMGKKLNEMENIHVWKMNKDYFPLKELEKFIRNRKDEFIENCIQVDKDQSHDSSLISETDYLFLDYSSDKFSFAIINYKGSCTKCKKDQNSVICFACNRIFCSSCIKKHRSHSSSCNINIKHNSSFSFLSCFCGKSKILRFSDIKSNASAKVQQESDSMIASQTASQDLEKKNSAKLALDLEATPSTIPQFQNPSNTIPVGLQNLGNTCFMNSALQCLLNCEQLSEFLLTTSLKGVINKSNLLGTKGQLATAYFELLQVIVRGNERTVAPWDLKNTVGKYAVQFSGYSQQDSHEFLLYLISGLHEDLKESVKKHKQNEINYKNDKETSDESWEQFIKTNKSIIVDLFYGQYKSTLSCPKCYTKSITFDPFNSISLPIPAVSVKTFEVNYVKYAWDEELLKVSSVAGNSSSVLEFKTRICEKMGKHLEEIRAFEIKLRVPFKEVNYFEAFIKPRDWPVWFFEVPRDIEAFCFVFILIDKTSEEFPCRLLSVNQNDTFESLLGKISNSIKPLLKLVYGESTKINYSVSSYSNHFIECIVCKSTLCDKFCKIQSSSKSLSSFLSKNKYFYIRVSIPAFTKSAQASKLKEFTSMKSPNLGLRIQDCFAAFSNPEQLDKNNSWKCPHCKNNVEAIKKMEIYRVPNIFIIHLKRFKSSGMYREKINSTVAFPRENLDIGNYVLGHNPGLYDLFAVSNHFGTLAGGHYTATVFNSLCGKWFDCNDSKVTETENISENASYLLFYKAKSSMKVGISV